MNIGKRLKLKDGKKYETAGGTVYKVRQMPKTLTFTDYDATNGHWWRYDGYALDEGGQSLIRRHYTKPQIAGKLDLQPGDKVLVVGFEDGRNIALPIGLSGELVGSDLISAFGIYVFGPTLEFGGSRPLFRVISRASWSK